ncbi:MAG: AraC family transcriptional regulator [Saprospiraceae bacterium]|nr:helix-turn-helix transcriptional regulator [Lewinella sp.]
MKILTLPDDIYGNRHNPESGILVHHYTALSSRFRERSILTKNAISLVISGKKTMHFAEKTVHVNDEEIHMLSAGNCLASLSISDQKAFESVLVFFDDQYLSRFYTDNAAMIAKLRAKYPAKPDAYLAFRKDDLLNNYIQSLLLTLKKHGQLSEQMKQIKLNELLLYLLENHTETFLNFKHPTGLSNLEIKIRRVVETNKFNNMQLDELAFLCNVSASTFKRHFKKIYDSTPSVWFNGQKMKLAGQLLTSKQQRPGEIWHKLGFETHTGFTKSFKKHFGSSPKEFADKKTVRE